MGCPRSCMSARPSQRRKTRTPYMDDAEAAPSPRAPMAALDSTLNASAAEDGPVAKPGADETALTTTEDADETALTTAEDAVALTTSAAEDDEAADAVGPLEAWGEIDCELRHGSRGS